MKPTTSTLSKFIFFALLFLTLGAKAAYGQEAKLQIDHLNHLSDKAVEIVDVTLDQTLIELAARFLPAKTADEAKLKELVKSIQGVYVRRFAFEQEGGFTDGDVNPIRSQLQGPGWAKIITYINRKKDGNKMNVEVFLMLQGSVVKGVSVLATESKALTVVNLVGPIDIEKLTQLEGRFGIPNIGLKQTTGQQVEDPDPKKKP